MRLASSVLALQRAEVDVNDGTTAMEVAVQAGATAPICPWSWCRKPARRGRRGRSPGWTWTCAGSPIAGRRREQAGPAGPHRHAVDAGPPAASPAGAAADRLALAGLKLDVADADLTTGGERPAWRAHLDLALKSLAATLQQPLPLTASIDDVSLGGLAATGEHYAQTR